MDYARAWRRRHGHPPKVGWGQPLLDEMPAGKSRYIDKWSSTPRASHSPRGTRLFFETLASCGSAGLG